LWAALDGLDTTALSDGDCRWLIERLAWVEKVSAAARVRVGAALRSRGDRDTAEWMARQTGQSSAKTRDELDAREQIEQCPATKAALDAGLLSQAQAAEIAKTEPEAPGSETDLIDYAKKHSLGGLKNEARKRRQAGKDREQLHARQVESMYLREWTNDLGMTCLHAELPPDLGVPIVARIRRETDRIFRQAYRHGRRDSNERYAAEAFVKLMNETSTGGSSKKADVVVVVNLNAYRRGTVADGEVCHIIDGGPIPVSIAREMAKDGFLKAVLHDGVNIHTVKHFGRHIPATLRTALELGPPPDFDGLQCADDGCDRRHGIEIDHRNPIANGGPTSASNLNPKCTPSHRTKTEHDRANGLLGPNKRRGPP
jgi:hypothetical protein